MNFECKTTGNSNEGREFKPNITQGARGFLTEESRSSDERSTKWRGEEVRKPLVARGS